MGDESDTAVLIAEAQTQQYGYVRCYRAVVRDCGVSAAYLYGLLEDYAQLSARNRRECMPSHEHLAKVMGVHRNTIPALLTKLRDAGWVTWTGGGKQRYVYSLPVRVLHKTRVLASENSAQKPGTACTESMHDACTNTVHKQEQPNKPIQLDEPPTPLKGGARRQTRRPIPDDWVFTPVLRAYAIDQGIAPAKVDDVAAEFHRHWLADGSPKANWDQAFRNRVLDLVGRNPLRPNRRAEVYATIVQPRALPEPMTEEEIAERAARRAALEAEREAEVAAHRAAAISHAEQDPARPLTIRPETWAGLTDQQRAHYGLRS